MEILKVKDSLFQWNSLLFRTYTYLYMLQFIFISVNFCFSFVLNSLTYITIPKNNHGKIKINRNKKLTTTYMIQCIITCICEGGLGKILTCNMALKQ